MQFPTVGSRGHCGFSEIPVCEYRVCQGERERVKERKREGWEREGWKEGNEWGRADRGREKGRDRGEKEVESEKKWQGEGERKAEEEKNRQREKEEVCASPF